MLRPVLVRRDEWQIHFGLSGARQFDLGLFGGILEPLQRKAILAQVDAILFAEFVGQVVHDPLVEILTSEEGIAVGRLDFEHAVADLENRNVERATAQIIDGDLAASLLIESVSKRGRGGFVDDAQHFETGNPAGVVRPPSAFSMTLALLPSITATQELVVPRSIPIAFAMVGLLVCACKALSMY